MNAADLYTVITKGNGQDMVVSVACAARGFCPADGSCPCPDAAASLPQQVVQARASVIEALLVAAVPEAEAATASLLAGAEALEGDAAVRRVGGMHGVHDHGDGYGACSCKAGEGRLAVMEARLYEATHPAAAKSRRTRELEAQLAEARAADEALGPCPGCQARRQYNVDGEVVHARLGSAACPPAAPWTPPVQASCLRIWAIALWL